MFHFMQPPSSSISWKPAWHSLLVSLPDPGIRQTFLQQAVMFLHALLSRRSHIPSSGQTASSQSEIALLCGASAVTRFSPDVPETERGESSQAWPIRWCSADSHDANCNLQYFTSFVTIAGPGELGHRGLLCKTSGCLPLALASLGRRAKLCFGGILGLTPDILTFCISHQETTDLFLIFFFFFSFNTTIDPRGLPAGGFANSWECGCRVPVSSGWVPSQKPAMPASNRAVLVLG